MSRMIREERGAAMMIAIMILAIVIVAVGAAVSVAVDTNGLSVHDSKSAQATQAAQAGLQAATYRLNMLVPAAGNCVGDAVASPDASGTCASSSETLANGTSYRYYTTPVMPASGTCIGVTITNTDVNQRCITAVGTAGGVTQRSQIRVAQFAALPIFPQAGLIGLNWVNLSGGASVQGSVSTNGTLTTSGGATIGPAFLGPAGTFNPIGSGAHGAITTLASPLVVSGVNPGTSNQTSLGSCPGRITACNDDYRIANGLAKPTVSPYDASAGSVTWTPSTRTLSLSGKSTSLTLGGGLYNFCSLNLSGGSSITLAATARVEIFIDSPDDPGSGCPANSGNVNISGSSLVNLSSDPTALQLYVYGLNNGSGKVVLSGSSAFTGVIDAPQSNITLSGGALDTGGIIGLTVTVSGNGMNWDSRVGTLKGGPNGLYYRTGWAQCSPTSSASTPGTGCG